MTFIKSMLIALSFICLSIVGEESIIKERGKKSLIQRKTTSINEILPNQRFVLSDTIDLQGKRFYMPENVIIDVKNGIFKNGILVGNNTIIKYNNRVFDRVRIEGSWRIPKIRTTMFCDLSYVNSLRDVLALTNPSIHNEVIVEKGYYSLSVSKNAGTCLLLNDNTTLILKGIIHLLPNGFTNYHIIKISGDNVIIKGNGSVIGDRKEHLADSGEWGMGITISGTNILVKNISIHDCWGDCIYVTGKSQHVRIENCLIDGGRRQGISVVSVDDLRINKCIISNIGGTDPEYAIDIEPNKNNSVHNVLIEKVKSWNCPGGFTANGRAEDSDVKFVIVRNCRFRAKGKPALITTTLESLHITKCHFEQEEGNHVIAFDHVRNLAVSNNTYTFPKTEIALRKNKEDLHNYSSWPFLVKNCEISRIENNTEL